MRTVSLPPAKISYLAEIKEKLYIRWNSESYIKNLVT